MLRENNKEHICYERQFLPKLLIYTILFKIKLLYPYIVNILSDFLIVLILCMYICSAFIFKVFLMSTILYNFNKRLFKNQRENK